MYPRRFALCAALVVFGFAVGRSSRNPTRASPPTFEPVAGSEIVVCYPTAAVAPMALAEPRPFFARARLRILGADAPNSEVWKNTAWTVEIGGREFAAAPDS